MPGTRTKCLILNTAERLFAERGFSDVSLRQIIAAAGVNLAAVHYHFGSKEALIDEVLTRRISPLNAERITRLQQAEQRAGKKGPPLAHILEALVGPALRLSRDTGRGGDMFMQLIGRALSDPNEKLQDLVLRQIKVVADQFLPALRRALPHLPLEELYWRMHFTIGGMAHTMTHGSYLRTMSGGLCEPNNIERIIEEMVAYAAAGLKAPSKQKGSL